jgi:hypothetical protein
MSRIEKRALHHLSLKRRFDLFWWEFDEDGKKNIIQEDLAAYAKLEGWIEDRERMKRELEEQKIKSRLQK